MPVRAWTDPHRVAWGGHWWACGPPLAASAPKGRSRPGVSGQVAPSTHPWGVDPRGSLPAPGGSLGGPPKNGASGTPCGAKPRGGGGAPPTNLILLRNQRSRPRRSSPTRSPAARPARGASLVASGPGSRRVSTSPPPGASPTVTAAPSPSRGVSAGSGRCAPGSAGRPPGCRLAFHWPACRLLRTATARRGVASLGVRQLLRNLAVSRPEPNPRGLRPTARVLSGPFGLMADLSGGLLRPLPMGPPHSGVPTGVAPPSSDGGSQVAPILRPP